MVLKTELARLVRPIQLKTDHQSGLIMTKNQKSPKNWEYLGTNYFNRKNQEPVWLNQLLADLVET